MTSPSFATRVGVSAAIVLAVTFANEAIHACSMARASALVGDLLGVAVDLPIAEPIVVPANFAVRTPPSDGDAGPVSGWVPFGDLGLFHPAVPYSADVQLTVGGVPVVTEATEDRTAPSAPSILSAANHHESGAPLHCGNPGRCGPSSEFEVQFSPSIDANAPPERVTYALFVGATAEEALAAATPFRLYVILAPENRISDQVDIVGGSDSRFVSLAGIDQAGNLSSKSAAVRVGN